MLVITEAIIVKVDDRVPIYEYDVYDPLVYPISRYGAIAPEVTLTRKQLRGKRFCRRHGPDIYIALAPEIEEVLELPIEAWDDKVDELMAEHAWQILKITESVNTAGLWTRLKYLFTGRLL